jgi:D-alanyl-D-alanine carboxypeptidase
VSIRAISLIVSLIFVLTLASAQDSSRVAVPRPSIPSQLDSARSLERLRTRLDAMFSSKAYRRSDVTAKVISISRGVTLYEREPHKPLTPASVTKLFTTNAGFYALGAEGLMKTEVRSTGRIGPDGTLKGDLYIVGSGDATLDVNDIETMADNLFAMGLRRLNGAVYADPSFFDAETNRADYSGDGEDVVRLPAVTALTHSLGEIKVVVSATAKGYVNVQTIPASDAFILRAATKRGTRPTRIRITSVALLVPTEHEHSMWICGRHQWQQQERLPTDCAAVGSRRTR